MPTYRYTMQKSGFRHGELHYGQHLYGMFPGAGGLIRVTTVVTGTTVFKAEMLASLGEAVGSQTLADLFANGWGIKGIQCSNASNEGYIVDITGFDQTTGQVTTAAMPANYVVGDMLWIAPHELLMPSGDLFVVTKRLTKTAVLAASAVDLTGVSSGGAINLVSALIQNGANAAGGASTGVFIKSNDTNEPLNAKILDAGGDLGASNFVHMALGYQSASGKKFQIQAGTSDLSGTGSITVHLLCGRGAAGANIAAA